MKFPVEAQLANTMFYKPQLLEIGAEDLDAEIAMQLMARCTVAVSNEAGGPVMGAHVMMNSGMKFFYSGITTGFTYAISNGMQLEQIRKTNQGVEGLDPAATYHQSKFRYDGSTKQDGSVTFENVPAITVFASVSHPDYQGQTANFQGNRMPVMCKPGEIAEVKMTLKKPDK